MLYEVKIKIPDERDTKGRTVVFQIQEGTDKLALKNVRDRISIHRLEHVPTADLFPGMNEVTEGKPIT